MELDLSVYRIDSTQCITGLDLIVRLDGHIPELAVKREIIAMVDHDALIIAREDHDLTDYTVEHGLCLLAFRHSEVESVVRRHHNIIDRVSVRSETSDHSTICRPRQLSLVLHELRRKLGIDFRLP